MLTRILTQYPALLTTFTVGVLLLLGVMVVQLQKARIADAPHHWRPQTHPAHA